jgi:hypothetical protein
MNWHDANQRSKPSESKVRDDQMIRAWLSKYEKPTAKPPEQRQERWQARKKQQRQERRDLATPLPKGVTAFSK